MKMSFYELLANQVKGSNSFEPAERPRVDKIKEEKIIAQPFKRQASKDSCKPESTAVSSSDSKRQKLSTPEAKTTRSRAKQKNDDIGKEVSTERVMRSSHRISESKTTETTRSSRRLRSSQELKVVDTNTMPSRSSRSTRLQAEAESIKTKQSKEKSKPSSVKTETSVGRSTRGRRAGYSSSSENSFVEPATKKKPNKKTSADEITSTNEIASNKRKASTNKKISNEHKSDGKANLLENVSASRKRQSSSSTENTLVHNLVLKTLQIKLPKLLICEEKLKKNVKEPSSNYFPHSKRVSNAALHDTTQSLITSTSSEKVTTQYSHFDCMCSAQTKFHSKSIFLFNSSH